MSERVQRVIRRVERAIGGPQGAKAARYLREYYRPRPLSFVALRGLEEAMKRARTLDATEPQR
ncbi:hypothetical protein UFOVP411_38 [uncultured Caudovirales phage]|uniref:Uncharacterized protein n=1 Tax=uncultured Caudovirales phage TaxID=2100421 RepID=A0A6J5M2A3_9CAUD|nr:hypothetical protein UFOVP411_38 [uncultured Caudovirales phage]